MYVRVKVFLLGKHVHVYKKKSKFKTNHIQPIFNLIEFRSSYITLLNHTNISLFLNCIYRAASLS